MNTSPLNLPAIRTKMEALGFSQADIAKRLNVTREAVSQWFQGNKNPRPALLLGLSRLLEMGFNELVLRDEVCEPVVADVKGLFQYLKQHPHPS
jgi:transcriptional regulator with XRE-family HTH domain